MLGNSELLSLRLLSTHLGIETPLCLSCDFSAAWHEAGEVTNKIVFPNIYNNKSPFFLTQKS